MVKLFANHGDPDQMPHSVASDLSVHCLPIKRSPVFNGVKKNISHFPTKITKITLNIQML